ncbi:hypothetical protein [Nonomuraea sp. NPDC049158]|uniref:hypothetical protein n=1 Tax=Nonomuraea sp. NPDC049158 TaxID=3155649 RepID=UPI0033EC9590
MSKAGSSRTGAGHLAADLHRAADPGRRKYLITWDINVDSTIARARGRPPKFEPVDYRERHAVE